MNFEPPPPRSIVRGLSALVLVACAAALTVALTWRAAAPRIEHNQRLLEQRQLAEVLPGVAFDNALADTRITLDRQAHASDDEAVAWVAQHRGQPVAVVLRVTAPDGYNRRIRLLIGLSPTGEVLGVRAIEHRETPGLGDAIEVQRSDWIRQFDGRRLGDPSTARWALRRDGGEFDGITGATITARAVTGAVRHALLYFERNGAALLAAAPEQTTDTLP